MHLSEVLSEIRVPFHTDGHHHCRTGWVQLDCPYCSPGSNRYRLGIRLKDNFTNCWVCGHHRLSDALCRASGFPWVRVKELIDGIKIAYIEETEPIRSILRIPKGIGPLLTAHKTYLKSRKMNPDNLERLWGLQGFGPHAGRLSWRIFIPVTFRGKTVTWTTRTIGTTGPRYLGAKPEEEAIPRNRLLYGEEYCRDTLIICEGPADVWAIGPGAVAIGGLLTTTAQINRMASFPTRVVLLDNEPDARRRALRLANTLAMFPGTTYNVTLDAKDPGAAPQSEIRRLRKSFLK